LERFGRFCINCTINLNDITLKTEFSNNLTIFNQNVRFLPKKHKNNIVYYAQYKSNILMQNTQKKVVNPPIFSGLV
jgi:hypothetical protein